MDLLNGKFIILLKRMEQYTQSKLHSLTKTFCVTALVISQSHNCPKYTDFLGFGFFVSRLHI